MFVTAAIFGIMAVLIYKGKTNLIHDYHQTKVSDQTGYGKAFGKAFGLLAGVMALSGGISLFGEGVAWIAVAIAVVGLIIGVAAIAKVQKKYNGGLF